MRSAMPSCNCCRRRASGARDARVMVPHSTSRPGRGGAPFPSPTSTTPYPVTDVPGSTPSTLTSPGHRRHRLGVNVEVGVDLGDVVHLFESLDQPEQVLSVFPLDLHVALREQRDLRTLHRNLC